jgi:hypothetical protein
MDVPGPASPLSTADSTMEDVKCTDVGYCSSSIFGLGNTRFGKEERHDSRCFCFILYRSGLRNPHSNDDIEGDESDAEEDEAIAAIVVVF